MAELPSAEREEFKAVLKRHGYQVADFGASVIEDPPPTTKPPTPYRVGNTVTVRRKGTSLVRAYHDEPGALHGPLNQSCKWTTQFEMDLQDGQFGLR
jgi:hypothetical protein